MTLSYIFLSNNIAFDFFNEMFEIELAEFNAEAGVDGIPFLC